MAATVTIGLHAARDKRNSGLSQRVSDRDAADIRMLLLRDGWQTQRQTDTETLLVKAGRFALLRRVLE